MNNLIKVFDNILTSEQCAYYINLINTKPQFPGKVFDNNESTLKQQVKDSVEINLSECREEVPFLLSTLQDVLVMYEESVGYYVPTTHCESICGRLYKKREGKYEKHIDTGNPSASSRTLAVLIYLNTVEEGGETEFPNLNTKVKPVAGRVLCFPPYWMFVHKGNIPISHNKYIIRAFLRNQ
jgi:hypothetical protein